jgi:hypothetical protein
MKRIGKVFFLIFMIPVISIACGTHGVHTQSDVNNLKCIAITNSITIEPNSSSINDPIYNLDTLISIISIGTELIIRNNPELTDISGLLNLLTIGQDLIIENNPKLHMCCALNNLLNKGSVGRSIIIRNNGEGDCKENGIYIQACQIIPVLSFWALSTLFLLLSILGCIILMNDVRPFKLKTRFLSF